MIPEQVCVLTVTEARANIGTSKTHFSCSQWYGLLYVLRQVVLFLLILNDR